MYGSFPLASGFKDEPDDGIGGPDARRGNLPLGGEGQIVGAGYQVIPPFDLADPVVINLTDRLDVTCAILARCRTPDPVARAYRNEPVANTRSEPQYRISGDLHNSVLLALGNFARKQRLP